MDSKNIFISYEHYSRNIEWEKFGESEWIYVGTDKEFDEEKANKIIAGFFTENELYLITDRHTSALIKREEALKKVKHYIQEGIPAITTKKFDKIIEFDQIGVLRKGILHQKR